MPLREMMRQFFDKLKSATSGYASLSYKRIEEREADVTRLDILLAEKNFQRSQVLCPDRAESERREIW